MRIFFLGQSLSQCLRNGTVTSVLSVFERAKLRKQSVLIQLFQKYSAYGHLEELQGSIPYQKHFKSVRCQLKIMYSRKRHRGKIYRSMAPMWKKYLFS